MLVRVGDGRSPRDHPSFAVTVVPLPPDAVSPVTRTVAPTVAGTAAKVAEVAFGPTIITSSRPLAVDRRALLTHDRDLAGQVPVRDAAGVVAAMTI